MGQGIIAHLISLIEALDGPLIPFLTAAFCGWGERKRAFALRLLFGREQEGLAFTISPASGYDTRVHVCRVGKIKVDLPSARR